MTRTRVASRFASCLMVYVTWVIVGLATASLDSGGAFARMYPSLTFALLPIPAAVLAVTGVTRRQFSIDIDRWRGSIFNLANRVRNTRFGDADEQREALTQAASQAAALSVEGAELAASTVAQEMVTWTRDVLLALVAQRFGDQTVEHDTKRRLLPNLPADGSYDGRALARAAEAELTSLASDLDKAAADVSADG